MDAYMRLASAVADAALDSIRADGESAGRAAGSWVIDGNSPADAARALVQGLEDGDPQYLLLQPSPLSGEWSDSPTPASLADEYGVDPEDYDTVDAICDAYEEGFSVGWEAEVFLDALQAGYLRSVTLEGWRVRTYYAGFDSFSGKTRIGYTFGRVGESPIFAGEDFYASPLHADDSDDTIRSLLGFLTLRPGDTDYDYFDGYTPEQIAFRDSDAETVAILFGLHEDAPSPLDDDRDRIIRESVCAR